MRPRSSSSRRRQGTSQGRPQSVRREPSHLVDKARRAASLGPRVTAFARRFSRCPSGRRATSRRGSATARVSPERLGRRPERELATVDSIVGGGSALGVATEVAAIAGSIESTRPYRWDDDRWRRFGPPPSGRRSPRPPPKRPWLALRPRLCVPVIAVVLDECARLLSVDRVDQHEPAATGRDLPRSSTVRQSDGGQAAPSRWADARPKGKPIAGRAADERIGLRPGSRAIPKRAKAQPRV